MQNEADTQRPSKARRTAELLGLFALFVFIAVVAYGLHFILTPRDLSYSLKACPLDAMQCPDGAYIGRTGSSCTFECSKHKGSPTGENSTLLFQRTASWGPCLLPDPKRCHDELTLSNDGVLRVDSVKGILDEKIEPETLEKIREQIRTSDVLHKDCSATKTVADYFAHYRITLDGVARDIDFPGCDSDLRVIDNILNQ